MELSLHRPRLFFLLGRFGDRYITVPQKITDAHAAVMGPSGAGKSTGLLIPNLIERCGTSMIVTEATNRLNEQADIFKKTAGFRKTMGHQIYWFNPTLMSSTKLNPLDVITNAEPNLRIVQAQKIAHLIVQNSHGKSGGIDSHWDKAAYLLLISLLMQIVEGIDDPKYKHIGTVLELLRLGPDQLNEYIKNSTSKRARQSFEIFFNNSTPGYARSVMVTLMPKLDAWVTPQVATLMSKSDVTPEQLSKQLFTFYLSVPSKRDDLKPLTHLNLAVLHDQRF
jgi:type IV secretion system protein VirD4